MCTYTKLVACDYIQDLDVAETIENVAKRLKQYRGLYNIIPIPTAKVPIVKFTDSRTRLEGDISLYNILVSSKRTCTVNTCSGLTGESVVVERKGVCLSLLFVLCLKPSL